MNFSFKSLPHFPWLEDKLLLLAELIICAKANQFIGPCSKILQRNETYFKTNFSIKDKYWTGNYVVVTMVACIRVGETFKNHRTLAMTAQQY